MKNRTLPQRDGIKTLLALNHPHLPTYTLWTDGQYTQYKDGKDMQVNRGDVMKLYLENGCYIESMQTDGGARCVRYKPDDFDNSWFERLKEINKNKLPQPQP